MSTMNFAHLHVHTHYSILEGHSLIPDLFERAEELRMPAIAITDHGNMYGVKEFFNCAKEHPAVKPIIGCEVHVPEGDLVLLAKNYSGYKNLMKIVTEANVNGYCDKPRISYEFIQKHSEGLICLSGSASGELPQAILADDMAMAEQIIKWHKSVFGEDYYLEVMKHKAEGPGLPDELYEAQCRYCDALFRLAGKYNINVVATNDVHFVKAGDAPLHDRLVCLETNSFIDDPYRHRYTRQEYLKTEEEMLSLFPEHPEVLTNTIEIVGKVEAYSIGRDVELPELQFDADFGKDLDRYLEKYGEIIKEGTFAPIGDEKDIAFQRSAAFLCHLAFTGAEKRYGNPLPCGHSERIGYELREIIRRHCQDYFLIVQDLVSAMRSRGVMVGPGRGSAAGSAVCYCLGITNLDPIKNGLLLEHFLSPGHNSMPVISIEFENHEEAIAYLKAKYGSDHVCHVISFATLGRTSAIKAVSRISHLSIKYGNQLAARAFGHPDNYEELLRNATGGEKEILHYAKGLERRTHFVGVHSCAIVIGREPISDYVPLTRVRLSEAGEDIIVTQYDVRYVDECGLARLNLLRLHPLAVINDCQKMIRARHQEDFNVDNIPLNLQSDKFHSASQALISSQTAWMKCHYPAEYYTAQLDNACSAEDVMDIIEDCKSHGITVLGPIVNKSAACSFVDDDGNIQQGLQNISGIPLFCVEAIIREREQNGEYEDINDFIERTCQFIDRTCIDKLLSAGALDCLGYNPDIVRQMRRADSEDIDELLAYSKRLYQEHK